MLFKTLTAVFVFLFLFILTNMALETPIGEFFSDVTDHIPFGDKMTHFIVMAVFSFLLNGTLKKRQLNLAGRQWLVGSLLAAFFITLEECSQAFIPSRHFEISDLVCNYAGIYAGGLLFLVILPAPSHPITGKANERNTTISLQTIFHRAR